MDYGQAERECKEECLFIIYIKFYYTLIVLEYYYIYNINIKINNTSHIILY